MTDFAGQIINTDILRVEWPDRKDIYPVNSAVRSITVDDPAPLNPDSYLGGTLTDSNSGPRVPARVDRAGQIDYATEGPAEDFFEKMHIIPRTFVLGNVLATQSIVVEVFNGYRRAVRSWTVFTNNAGTGVSLEGQPGLPINIAALGSITGLTLEISTNGPPVVDTTLDWTFDTGIVQIPISFRRVVLFAVAPPERPFRELLSFRTSVLPSKSGKEQRIKLRSTPRQSFAYEFVIFEGEERSTFDNFLFDQQGSQFGIPVWQEMTFLTQDVVSSSVSLAVQDTSYGDFRVDDFVVVYTDRKINDVVLITALTATTITLDNGVTSDYPKGTMVMPVRLCATPPTISGQRAIRGATKYAIDFRVVTNATDIGSALNVGTFNSKVLIDGDNWTRGSSSEQFERELTTIDNETGVIFQKSPWSVSKHGSVLTFLASGRQQIWELRRLLHFLSGRQVSFYLPTNQDDFEIQDGITVSDDKVNVNNTGYFQYVQARAPKNVIRITFNNGDAALVRTVNSSTEVSASKETLTLSDVWPDSYTVDQVQRIELVELVRFDSDEIEIEWSEGERTVRVEVPVKTVFA